MDADVVRALAGESAKWNVAYIVIGLFVIIGAFAFIACLGERTLGLDLRKFVDNVEAAAASGNVWPGVVAFIVIPSFILSLVIYVALR